MKKARFFYLHPDANAGKIAALEALQSEYTSCLAICTQTLLNSRRFSVALKDLQTFFPTCETLSSQIVKNARSHAVAIVKAWSASKYTLALKSYIKMLFKAKLIDEEMRSCLFIIGKKSIDRPSGRITQQAIDLYWSLLLDEEICGKPPQVSTKTGMRLSEMTATLAKSETTSLAAWWLAFSHLDAGKRRIELPLLGNPYISHVNDASKGILARKTKDGRWRFEVVEKKDWLVPEPKEGSPKIGVDVGLNVVAATSDGRLWGADLKPQFNKAYQTIKSIRANRQRQGLPRNSPRLDRFESKLTGLVKTMAGTVANELVRAYPSHTFVLEDLDLRGCRGQKRFAYRALYHALYPKAPTQVVNPAYTSQPCPSCLYVSRRNRHGIHFVCQSCGKRAHADYVGAVGLVRRSDDKEIGLEDHYLEVGALLRARYVLRRTDSAARARRGGSARSQGPARPPTEPAPSGQRLTTRESPAKVTRTASNQLQLNLFDQV